MDNESKTILDYLKLDPERCFSSFNILEHVRVPYAEGVSRLLKLEQAGCIKRIDCGISFYKFVKEML